MTYNISEKQRHLDLINEKGNFKIECSVEIFHTEELQVLWKYGHWFQALTDGILRPITDEQKQFVNVSKNLIKPSNLYERAWFKYQGRRAHEIQMGEELYKEYYLREDTFYSREMHKRMKGMMYNEMHKNHKI